MSRSIFVGSRIFDGDRFHDDKALLVDDGRVVEIVNRNALPEGTVVGLEGGLLVPGFVDAQVNGGAGRMLNDEPSAASMFTIAAGHRPYGTTALLPTLITDTPDKTVAAIAAAREAVAVADGGVAGLHLEGPHLAPSRKGAHLAALMRPVEDVDVARFVEARAAIGTLLVTVAAEQISLRQIRALAQAGVIVSIGHSDADSERAQACFDAGARGVTHLFNAMSQIGHRNPGLAGAALDHPDVWCGIIADGHHVDPKALRIALRAKQGTGRLFLVTDAMSLVGSDQESFTLNGRVVRREKGGFCSRLVLDDGTLAGSDVDMASAIRYGVTYLDLPLAEALRMASAYPARFLGLDDRGHLKPGARADFVHLTDALEVKQVWLGGTGERL